MSRETSHTPRKGRTRPALSALLAVAAQLLAMGTARAGSFVNFESGHVRPLAISPDGRRLFAVNTPDNRVEVFDIASGTLSRVGEVEVGLEPVAIAARSDTEVWVVNHLSDSVSVVQLADDDPPSPRVVATLEVGDEPRDIVFARADRSRAFITTAHRGQNRPSDPQLTTEGIGRADVWVFDATTRAALPIIALFSDTPRALAVSPDGGTVYAAAFHSGNQTTTITQLAVSAGAGLPPPPAGSTPGAPDTGLIVKFNQQDGKWEDELGRDWSSSVPFSLPDKDVFLINANVDPPALAAGTNFVTGVGTILFNMAVRPDNGKLYVSNTDARNQVRFETLLDADHGVQGHITESRITVIDGTSANPIRLNPHIDYSVVPGPPAEVEQSLAFPTDLAFSSDGQKLYVAALGSGKVGVLDTDDLEAGVVTEQQIEVGLGPSGLALDEPDHRLYVMNRIDHTISVVDTVAGSQVATVALRYDPSPPAAKIGRRFLYDARDTSAHGDAACASCHIFGDFDSLAWDLGDPFGDLVNNPNPFRNGGNQPHPPFHPLKGPMTTQSLRGLAEAGPMHWRGDRTAGNDPGGDPLDEDGAFKKFNPAFVSLLGHASQLSDGDLQDFTNFILTMQYPPNPVRALDDVATTAQAAGDTFFNNTPVDAGSTCEFCHRLPLGTDGFSSFEGETQQFKIAHLRNAYQKVGMFGFPAIPNVTPGTGFLGDQVRGFGFTHDGGVATVFLFHNAAVFNFGSNPNQKRRNLEQFILAFDTGLKPVVGQQISVDATTVNSSSSIARINLLLARADAGDCDLVVKGVLASQDRGWLYQGGQQFKSDRASEPPIGADTLRLQAATAGQERTYTCVPPGSGTRIGIDRDEDGALDRDELDAGSDPADPASLPPPPTIPIRGTALTLKDDSTPPINLNLRKLSFRSAAYRGSPSGVVLPASAGSGDPTRFGAVLTVYNASGTGEKVVVDLPASNWTKIFDAHFQLKSYKYSDPRRSVGPISILTLDAATLKITGGGAGWLYALNAPPQGSVALQLALGSQPAFCALLPARSSGNPPSTARYDKLDSFVGAPNSPPPASCPAVP